ncbi:aldo/keto reductase [candidate division KSB1 bacterium]
MDFTEKRTLGKTGLSVSRLGLAGGYGIQAASVEKAFHEYDVNYFYWSTPRKTGMRDGLRSLVRHNRDNMVIVLQSYDHLGFTVKRAVRKGLKSLGIDYADVLLLGYFRRNPPRKIIDEVMKLKERGTVRFLALSGHNRKFFGEMAQQSDSPVDIFMTRYNAVHRGAEQDIFPHLTEENRPGITIYTATCWGKLLNPKKMPPGEPPLTASDCYRFVLTNPHVDLCMTGPKNELEMDEGMTALKKGPLSDEEMEHIRKTGDYIYG